MYKALRGWFSSKRGKNTTITVLGLALVISIIGQVIGWSNIGRLVTGTAGPGMDGYSCLPTCVEDDAKFLSMPGEQSASFGGASVVGWIEAPIGQSSFEIGIFDGDSGMDDAGDLSWADGNWDTVEVEAVYTLYADPTRDGTGTTIVGQWMGNTVPMPNNEWYDITVQNVDAARGSDGKYYYRFEATRDVAGVGINAFKLRSTGQLSTGRSELMDSNFAIVAMLANLNDVAIVYPEFSGDINAPGPSNYTGEWDFYFDVPPGTKTLSFWDGDFDRGSNTSTDVDTDDPNTASLLPPFANPDVTVPERAGGQGIPADDSPYPIYLVEPPARYEVIGPQGSPVFVNDEPSGTEEWERFVVTSDDEVPDSEVDLRVETIPPGLYTLRIEGLDLYNTVWFRINYEIKTDDDECPECPVCERCEECPVTATPEPTNTPEPKPTNTPVAPTKCPDPKPVDLLYVLDVSGSMDQLYPGSGKKLEAAQSAIYELNKWVKDQNNGSRVALYTFHSAGKGRGNPPLYLTDNKLVSSFTADIDAFNNKVKGLDASGGTPTAKALNDVTDWLPDTWDKNHLPVIILISDGVPTVDLETYGFQDYDVQVVNVYDGSGSVRTVDQVRNSGKTYDVYKQKSGEPLADTMLAIQNLETTIPDANVYAVAVQAEQNGIFNDQILRYAAEHTGGEFYMATNTTTLVESLQRAYVDSACGESEPPGGDAKAALPSECANTRTNLYHVENTTNKPFRSIKYEYRSGTEIKNQEWDEFQFTITNEEAAALTQVKIQAKAAGTLATATLKNCDFAGSATCGPVANRRVQFSFQGAVDNGNGTMTLTFRVQNNRGKALSYVAIGLPEGVTPIWPDDTYQSEVCLD